MRPACIPSGLAPTMSINLQHARSKPWHRFQCEWRCYVACMCLVLCGFSLKYLYFFLLVFFSLNLCEPRACLLRVSYWGSHGSVQKDMDAAYAHFKQFLRTTGIASTQPPFKTWMVLGLLQLVRFGMLIKTIG